VEARKVSRAQRDRAKEDGTRVKRSLYPSLYLHSVSQEAESQSVCSALRDALGEVHHLSFLRLDNLSEGYGYGRRDGVVRVRDWREVQNGG
jgi:hypothetical protein